MVGDRRTQARRVSLRLHGPRGSDTVVFKGETEGTDREDAPMPDLSRRQQPQEDFLTQYFKEIEGMEPLTVQEEAELSERIKRGDHDALERLVRANLRFVLTVARQYRDRGLPLEDLIGVGNLGLMEAAKRFDGTKGVKFISYAVWWIRQTILQALGGQVRTIRLPLNRVSMLHSIHRTSSRLEHELGRKPDADEVAAELNLSAEEVSYALQVSARLSSLEAFFNEEEEDRSFLDVLEDESQPRPDEAAIADSLHETVEKTLSTLKDQEAEVLRLYFGIDRERLTLEEIGINLGLTRERVRQIKERALQRLRHKSRSQPLRAYIED